VRLDLWLPMYRDICREFGYDMDADARNAAALSAMLSSRHGPTLSALESACPSSVTVCGDGPMLRRCLSEHPPEGYVIAADGATTALMDAGLVPDAIVTDLDGAVEHQLEANARGSLVFAHAHGDNARAVEEFVPRFKGTIVGTCQGRPAGVLLNLGGFTDGDRAACIFSGLGARRIVLMGFDFESPSPKQSRSAEVKARKLRWARRILASLAEQGVTVEGL